MFPDDFAGVQVRRRIIFLFFHIVADYCIKHQCQNKAKCVNSHSNYTCACNSSGWTGNYCEKGKVILNKEDQGIAFFAYYILNKISRF